MPIPKWYAQNGIYAQNGTPIVPSSWDSFDLFEITRHFNPLTTGAAYIRVLIFY